MSGILSASASGLILPGQIRPILPSDFAVPDGLVGYFPLGVDCLDFTNSAAFDLTSFYTSGGLVSFTAAALINSPVGQGLTFTGSPVNIQLNPAIDRATTFSTACWYRPTSHPANGVQLTTHSKTSTVSDHRNFSFDHRGSDYVGAAIESLLFAYRATGGGSFAAYSAPFSPVLSTWYHLCWTVNFTQSPTVAGLYINAVNTPLNSTGATTSQPDLAATQVEMLGSINSGDYLIGSLSDFRIYNRIIYPWEVTAIYQAGVSGRRDGGIFLPQIDEMPALFVASAANTLFAQIVM